MHAALLKQFLTRLVTWSYQAIPASDETAILRLRVIIPTLLIFLTKRFTTKDLKHLPQGIHVWLADLLIHDESPRIDEHLAGKLWEQLDRCYVYKPRDFPPNQLTHRRYTRWCVNTLNPAIPNGQMFAMNVLGIYTLELLRQRELYDAVSDRATFLYAQATTLTHDVCRELIVDTVLIVHRQHDQQLRDLGLPTATSPQTWSLELVIDELFPFIQSDQRRLTLIGCCRTLDIPIPD